MKKPGILQAYVDTAADTLYPCYKRPTEVRNFGWHQTVGQYIEELWRKSHTKPGNYKPSSNFPGHLNIHKVYRFEAPGHPSMIGCQQAHNFGNITINIEEISKVSVRWAAQQTI